MKVGTYKVENSREERVQQRKKTSQVWTEGGFVDGKY